MKEFNGDLKGFPEEVVEKMLERQVEQGNPRDVAVFEGEKLSGKYQGGFDWYSTEEGDTFWRKIIEFESFDTFFERYPKQSQKDESPTFPCLMWVWDDDENKASERVVIFKNALFWVALIGIKTIEDIDNAVGVMRWHNASLIDPRTKTVTKDEATEILSNHFNQKVEIV
jgi:hypothetical protein